jgi:hypothetical protein
MAKDALLQTLATIASATQISTSGNKLYSPPVSLEPFGSNGVNNLFMRWICYPGITYAAVPNATTGSAVQFGYDVSKDGTTWAPVHQSPLDLQPFKTHDVYTFSMAISQSNAVFLYPTVSSTATLTSGSASITAAPVVSIGDIVYFGATANGFTTATPYYVVSSTPTSASTGSSTSTCTIQVALASQGTPISATGAGTPTVTKYLTNLLNISVGDQLVLTGTTLSGTPGSIASGDTVNVISVTAAYTGLTVTFNKVSAAIFVKDTSVLNTGSTYLTRALNPSGEYYFPIMTVNGYIDQYGQVQDTYKYIRGWVSSTFPSGVNPTFPSVRCDLVPSRDGAYS